MDDRGNQDHCLPPTDGSYYLFEPSIIFLESFRRLAYIVNHEERYGHGIPGELALAVIEAVNNSLEHGYALASGDVSVALDCDAAKVVVTVTDRGRGLPPQPRGGGPDRLAERGRGSWLMQQTCDEVRHEFAPGLQSVVLVKRRDLNPTTLNGVSV